MGAEWRGSPSTVRGEEGRAAGVNTVPCGLSGDCGCSLYVTASRELGKLRQRDDWFQR